MPKFERAQISVDFNFGVMTFICGDRFLVHSRGAP
jgi:hypothetical protein